MKSSVVLPRVPGLRIGRCLGHGGMGAVYLARDAAGHRLAVKVIASAEVGVDERLRFHREIEALASVRHPHVVKLVGSGEIAGRPYALLERIAGRPLSRVRACSIATVADLGWQLARAVAAIHDAGWLHREIKLGNALVDQRSFLTLIDLAAPEPAARPSAHAIADALEPLIGGACELEVAAEIDGTTWPALADRRFTAPIR